MSPEEDEWAELGILTVNWEQYSHVCGKKGVIPDNSAARACACLRRLSPKAGKSDVGVWVILPHELADATAVSAIAA